MKKYRKITTVVEGEQVTVDNIYELEKWCRGSVKGESYPISERCIDIQTYEGEIRAKIGDYIIKDSGRFFVAKLEVFNLFYEEI